MNRGVKPQRLSKFFAPRLPHDTFCAHLMRLVVCLKKNKEGNQRSKKYIQQMEGSVGMMTRKVKGQVAVGTEEQGVPFPSPARTFARLAQRYLVSPRVDQPQPSVALRLSATSRSATACTTHIHPHLEGPRERSSSEQGLDQRVNRVCWFSKGRLFQMDCPRCRFPFSRLWPNCSFSWS